MNDELSERGNNGDKKCIQKYVRFQIRINATFNNIM